MARAVEQRINELKPQEVANTAWAFATVNVPDEKLFTALARGAERRDSEFSAQGLVNTVWAFALTNLLD